MAEEIILPKQEELYADPELREMIDAGVFFGRKKSRTHPRMRPYILGNRNGIELINLVKTREDMDKALALIKEKVLSGGTVLFVGTQPPAEEVKNVAVEFSFPVVVNRWLGGTLTNSKIILGRLDYYKKLKNDLESGAFKDKYTKKELLEIEREAKRLGELFGGLEGYSGRLDVMVVVDANLHHTAVREANKMNIPVVAFINTDTDPDDVKYGVVGNNKAKTSINWFLGKIRTAIKEAMAARQAAPPIEAVKAPETV
ncbi:MAG: 30S ribosomal protein S2 [Patescibacteria group bacterium]